MDDEGHSVGRIEGRAGGWWSAGEEVLVAPEGPIGCRFEVELGADWLPTAVSVASIWAGGTHRLDLRRDTTGRWSSADGVVPDLDGCLDVDIAATPLTNTYPIRRYADLPIGESRAARVAWVEVPSLRVEAVEQTYIRIGANEWTYADPKHGSFRITVDDDGLVLDYEGFAERIR